MAISSTPRPVQGPAPAPASRSRTATSTSTKTSSTSSSLKKRRSKNGSRQRRHSRSQPRRVHFDGLVHGRVTLHHNDYTKEEFHATWYSTAERKRMRQDLELALQQIAAGSTDALQRGLESRMVKPPSAASQSRVQSRFSQASAMRSRLMSKAAVLEEHSVQQEEGVHFPETIARIYRKYTAPCRVRALLLAQMDRHIQLQELRAEQQQEEDHLDEHLQRKLRKRAQRKAQQERIQALQSVVDSCMDILELADDCDGASSGGRSTDGTPFTHNYDYKSSWNPRVSLTLGEDPSVMFGIGSDSNNSTSSHSARSTESTASASSVPSISSSASLSPSSSPSASPSQLMRKDSKASHASPTISLNDCLLLSPTASASTTSKKSKSKSQFRLSDALSPMKKRSGRMSSMIKPTSITKLLMGSHARSSDRKDVAPVETTR